MSAKVDQTSQGKGASILVVEDDLVLIEAIGEILESSGYTVITAENGDLALQTLVKQQPDLILASTTLSDVDGLEFYRTVRKILGERAAFLFLASQEPIDDSSFEQIMATEGYVIKPITSKNLLATVRSRMQRAHELKIALELDHSNKLSLLVVEDDLAMLIALRDILEGAGYKVSTATNGREALQRFGEVHPALVLSDISMPIMDGIELFEAVRQLPGGKAVPFIFLTARGTRQDVLAGMSLGADDYITKPVTSQELIAAVKARLTRANELLLAQLKIAYKSSLFALANAIEARDKYTHDHVLRTNAYAQAIAQELGWNDSEREILEFGAILHDIGKLEVPIRILQKKDPLSPEEWEQMRKHPVVGSHMIAGIDYLAPAVPVIRHHHERWDGSGYPDGLQGEKIPVGARLLAVVDTFEALTTDRPYREAVSPQVAYEEILNRSGVQYDPTMVDAFTKCWENGKIQMILQGSSGDHEQDDS